MLFDRNANDPVNKNDLTFVAKDLSGLTAYARWHYVQSTDISSPTPKAAPTYQAFPMHGGVQAVSFMQNSPGYTPNIGWSHELLLRVLIHDLEIQPARRVGESVEPTCLRSRAIDCLREGLAHLLAAEAVIASDAEERATWENKS